MALEAARFLQLRSAYVSVYGYYQRRKALLIVATFIVCIVLAYFFPQRAADLWLTRDQQGRISFVQGHYEIAARQFTDTRWKAYSLYGDEQFDQAAAVYGQLEQAADVLARANALAHARRYVKARDIYQRLLQQDPSNTAAQHNIAIVQKIIDDVNRMSASQQAEEGDAPKELGDNPQTGDGADEQGGKEQDLKQYDAEELLLNPDLNAMWLRQVQKNPAFFLSNKFYGQYFKNEVDEQQTQDDVDE
jgi:Ca-activated chloride channel family protein